MHKLPIEISGKSPKPLSVFELRHQKWSCYGPQNKKTHTYEEGGAHLINSLWLLLMNMKNNYLLKKNGWSEPLKKLKILTFTLISINIF